VSHHSRSRCVIDTGQRLVPDRCWHEALGLCSACWQRRPERPFVRAAHLAARLTDPPGWLDGFVAHLAAGNGPARACAMITELGRLLEDEHPNHPRSVLERARRPGRSMGSLARALQDYFTVEGLALPTDQAERLAAGRRQRRIDAVPPSRPPWPPCATSPGSWPTGGASRTGH
jgi:hypothetical protein